MAFIDFEPEDAGGGSVDFDAEPAPSTDRGILGSVADIGLTAAKGAIGVPETVVGIADLLTFGQAGKLAEEAGFLPKEAKAMLDQFYTPAQQAANEAVKVPGFLETLKAAIQNPSTILHAAIESTPSMLGGGVIARGLLKAAPAMAPLAAGAIGEGVVTAGQNAEQLRQETPGGTLTAGQSALMAGSGALTGLLGFAAGGRAAKKLGIADIDTWLAKGGSIRDLAQQPGLLKRVSGGMLSEGVFEELPQSAQEQIAQNIALQKPWNENVGNAAAMGMLVGTVMGGGANVLAPGAEPAPPFVPQNIPAPIETAGRVMSAPTLDAAIAETANAALGPAPRFERMLDESAAGGLIDSAIRQQQFDQAQNPVEAQKAREERQILLDSRNQQADEAITAAETPPLREPFSATPAGTPPNTALADELKRARELYTLRRMEALGIKGTDEQSLLDSENVQSGAINETESNLARPLAPENGSLVPQTGTLSPNQAVPGIGTIVPKTGTIVPNQGIPADAEISPKTVGGIPVSAQSTEQLQAIVQNPETPPTTRHAAVAAIQARAQNSEVQGSQPVAESQALAPEASDTGAAPRQAAALPETPQNAPGSELANGFRSGPEDGSKYRVGQVRATGGALMLEKRSSIGTANSFYVDKNGNLVDADTVVLNKPETIDRLWKPETPERAAEARRILGEMGKLSLTDPKRAALKAELKALVTKTAQNAPGQAQPATPADGIAAAPPAQGAQPAQEPKQEFASTQTPLPKPIAAAVMQQARQLIAPEDVELEHGLEDNPHITVKYGLHSADVAAVQKVASGHGPVEARVTGIEIFKPEGKDYEVVVARVDSPGLHALNKAIADAIPHTDTFPTYKPHITLGYVKKGTGEKYADAKPAIIGKTFTLDTIDVSDQDENATPVKLTGKPSQEPAVLPVQEPVAEKATIAAEKATPKPVSEMTPADLLRAAADKLEGKPSEPATKPQEGAANRSGATTEASKVERRGDTGIVDFGQKIEGARKDYAAKLAEAKDADIASVPLSQSWPEPDYQKLLDGGADPWAIAFMHAARDEIPTKPQQSWKLKRWVAQVELLRNVTMGLADGTMDVVRAKQLMDEGKSFQSVRDRTELYQEVGHEKSLKGIRISSGSYGMYNRVEYNPPKVIWSVEMPAKATWGRWPKMLATGDTRAEAIANFKKAWLETTPEQDTSRAVDFQIYSKTSRVGEKSEIFIGKKIGAHVAELKGGFTNVKEARAWKDANQAELVKLLERYKTIPYERKETNSPRVGIDHRNGADVTPERFTEAFGFRGVQFGNYVEGSRRQADLNETYDALMDLAGVLDIPPKALSLNGELGLAFGARGTGGKRAPSAHYEPDLVVINLTKTRGAGSLAHEWFHGVDNYFARAGGSKVGYMTEAQAAKEGVRPEMVQAFKEVMQAIQNTELRQRSIRLDQTRSKPYWQTRLEMAARSFETYIVAKLQDQNASNDYLANIVSEGYWEAATALGVEKENTYPYPTASEMAGIRAAFDGFFQTVETRETDKGTELFNRDEESLDPSEAEARTVQTAVEGKSIQDAARFIMRSGTEDQKLIAGRVLIQLQRLDRAGVVLDFKVAHIGDTIPRALLAARGLTSWKFAKDDNKITVWVNGADVIGKIGASYETLLHELVHAATAGIVHLGNLKAASEGGYKSANDVHDLYAVTNHIRSYYNQRISDSKAGKVELTEFERRIYHNANNAIASPNEVLAWGLSNRDAQAYFESIAYPEHKSAWTAFVEAIRKLLGIPARAATALSEVLRISENLMGENTDDILGIETASGDETTIQSEANSGLLPQVSETDTKAPYNIDGSNTTGDAAGNRASWDAPEPGKLDTFIRVLQDKHIDTKRVVTAIKNATGALRDATDVYLQEELFHGRSAKAVAEFLDMELRPLFTEMAARKIEMPEFEEYLHARHAEERNKQIAKINPEMPDGGSGMDTADARAYIEALEPAKKRAYEALAERVDAINAKTRQDTVAYGLESPDTILAWEDTYKNYVPLHREDMEGGPGIGQGYSVRGPASKRATGSKRAVVDILANVAMQRERVVVRGEKNRVANALVGLASENPNPDFWKVDKPPILKVVNDRTGLVEERVDPLFKSRENVIVARIPGPDGNVVEHAIIFNERDERATRMVTALKNLDAQDLGEVLGLSAKITRYFSSINTQYNPVFGVVNLIRDTQGALFNLSTTDIRGKQSDVLKHTISALRGIYIDARAARGGEQPTSAWSELWEEFQREGGQTGYRDMFRTSKDRAEAIEREIKKVSEGKAKQFGRSVFDWLSDYNNAMENAVRLAAYKVGKENGMTNQRAASMAKNLTVNFNRKGQIGVQTGALYAFFNASVQGTARMLETLNGPSGRKIIAGGFMLGSMQALLLAAAGFDDDEPPDFVRERSLILPIGNKKYLTIPMPLGLHILPNLGRIPTEFVLGGFKRPQKKIASLINVFVEAFNPIGNAGLSLQTIAPTVIDPIAALAENKDWTGKPIAREDFNKLAPTPGHTRAKDTASVFSKAVSQGLNWVSGGTNYKPGIFSPTPDQIDYLIGQVAGGLGREAMKAEQTVTSAFSGEELPTYKIPLLGRFYGSSEGQAQQGNTFYSNLKEINEHEAEIKGRRKAGEPIGDYITVNPEARLVGYANKVERQVSQLRRQKRELAAKGADKDRIKAIDARITQLMRAFNDRVRSVTEKKAA